MRWYVHVNLWHAAAGNVWRHKGKTLATFVPLLVVVTVFAALSFVRDGMAKDALLAADALPDLTVQRMIGGRPDRLSTAMVDRISRVEGVDRAAPRVWGYAPVQIGGGAFTYTLIGIDTRRMPKPDAIGLSIERGRFLNKADTNGAVLGKVVAEGLNTSVGDDLILKDDLGNSTRFRVVGLFTSDVQIHVADWIVVPVQAAREFFGYRDDEATDLCVYLTDPSAADSVATAILASIKGVRVLSREAIKDIAQQVYGSRAGVFQLLWIILLLTVMLVAWAEAGSVSLSMSREIGILKATGWSTANVIEMKVFENVMIAGCATLGGMLLGFVYLLAGAPGIKSYFLGWAVIYPDMEIPIQITLATVATIVAIGIFPLLVATIVPAWLAGVVDPDEAMRG
jgi:lipoprotein-releasing system permease protein